MKRLLWLVFVVGCASRGDGPPVLSEPTLADLTAAGDSSAAGEVNEADDLPVNASLEKAISGYRELLPEVAETELAPEILRRLADLQLERYEVAEAQAPERESGKSEIAAVSALYAKVLNDYPQAADNEQVHYQLARVYEAQGDSAAVLAVLDDLVERYPEASRIDEVQFRRGELLFSDKQFDEAVLAYEQVINYGDSSPFYDQSLYKHGWALFKQFQYDEGLDSFLVLLDRKFDGAEDPRTVLESASRGEREQMDDSLRAVSLTFSYQDGADSIGEYFDKRDNSAYVDLLYERLAEHYLESERFSDAAATFESYAERHQLEDKAPLFMVRVIDVYEAGGFPKQVLAARQSFVERYDLRSEYWAERDPAESPEVTAHLRSSLDTLARYHHAAGQKQKSGEDYASAIKWYRIYLRDFSDAEKAPEMNFLLAEALYETGQYANAALEYEATAYSYPLHEKKAEAGYAALLAYGEHAKSLQGEEAADWHKRSIESSLQFAGTFPEHPQSLTVLTRASEDLYANGELPRAEKAARDVLAREGVAQPLQRSAWIVIAHVGFDEKRYASAEQAYARGRSLTDPKDKSYPVLSERLAASIYQQGEQARANGNLSAAAGHFLRVGKQVPDATIRATAQYDAAAAYIGLSDWQRSAAVLEDFRKAYPDHELQGEVDRKLALVYMESKQPGRAAGEFERIAASTTDPTEKRSAMLQAADLYEEGGQGLKAAVVLAAYVTAFPKPANEAIEIQQRLVEVSESVNDQKAHDYWLRQVVKTDAKAGNERTDRTRLLAANASLELAKPHLQAYRARKLEVPLNKSLPRKQKSMEKALAAYNRAAEYGVEAVTTEATFQIGDIYFEFSQALFDSERPKNLNAEELEQYDILLEEQAYPFEEKAIEIHELNAYRVGDGVYDDWVKRSFDRLATLLPARYAKSEQLESYVETLP